MAKPCRRGSVGVACMATRVQGAFPAGCHKTQAVPGGHRGRPYGGDGSAAVQTALCNPRAFHERPLTQRGPMWPARERWLRQMHRPQRSSAGGVDNPPVSLREPAPFTQGGLWGATIQTASRSRHRAHYERPLRGADAQCALSTVGWNHRGAARIAGWFRAAIQAAPTAPWRTYSRCTFHLTPLRQAAALAVCRRLARCVSCRG